MSQGWGFSTGILKHCNFSYLFSLDFFQYFRAYANPENTALVALCRQLKRWNSDRVVHRTAQQQALDLTLEDVNAIKEMVHAAVRKTPSKLPEIMSDQLLFLTVGAIQTQAQTGSDKAWNLVEQSIHRYVDVRRERRLFSFGLFTVVLLIGFSTTIMNHSKVLKSHHAVADSPLVPAEAVENESDADPVTMSMLQLAYHKMKAGTCQLPQAAMLPQEQRHAFLLFVNKGVVEVQNVENLRLALGYVNCLYPQELMRPLSVQ